MKLEQEVASDDKSLCFILTPENLLEEALLKLIGPNPEVVKWYDGRIGLKSQFSLNKSLTARPEKGERV